METILKKYAIFIAIIVLIFGAGIYFVAPKISEVFSVQSELSSKKSQIKNLEQDVESAKLAKQRAESKKDEPKIEKLIYESEYKSYDSKVNFNGMLETVLALAKQAGLKVKTIEFKNVPESDPIVQNHSSEYETTLLSAQFYGTYTQFQTFMRDVYRHQYLMGIKDFKIVPYEFDKKILKIDMSLALYMKK